MTRGSYKRAQLLNLLPVEGEIVRKLSRGFCLDAGCGIGPYFPFFKAQTLIGLDINAKRLRKIKRRVKENVRLVVGDVRALPFRGNVFDFIIAFEVIEHLPKKDGRLLVSELKRVAKKRTHIVIMTPNNSFPFGYMIRFVYEIATMIKLLILKKPPCSTYSDQFDLHLSQYTRSDLLKLGFQVHGVDVLGYNLLKPIWKRFPLLRKLVDRVLYNAPLFTSHLLGILEV